MMGWMVDESLGWAALLVLLWMVGSLAPTLSLSVWDRHVNGILFLHFDTASCTALNRAELFISPAAARQLCRIRLSQNAPLYVTSCALRSTSHHSIQHGNSHSLHREVVAKPLALFIVPPLSSLHPLSMTLLLAILTLSYPQPPATQRMPPRLSVL